MKIAMRHESFINTDYKDYKDLLPCGMDSYRFDINVQFSCKVNAMSSLLGHCRAAAENHGEAVMFNVQCSMFNLIETDYKDYKDYNYKIIKL